MKQRELFEQRFDILEKENKNFCVITGKKLYKEEVKASSFAHILPKGMYPEFKFYPNNIALVCDIPEHNELDHRVNLWKQEHGTKKLIDLISNGDEVYHLFIN